MPLKSAISEKNMVSVRRSAWFASLPTSWLMRRGSTNFPKVSLICSRERSSSTILLNDRASRLRTGRDGAGTGHELAQAAHRLGRSHGADAETDAAGGDEQGKA